MKQLEGFAVFAIFERIFSIATIFLSKTLYDILIPIT
jgi:hypothetical protein